MLIFCLTAIKVLKVQYKYYFQHFARCVLCPVVGTALESKF